MQCGWIGYANRGEARRAVDMIAKHKGIKGRVAIYECQWCGMYHWGHSYKKSPKTTAKQRFMRAQRRAQEAAE